jgi:hypothetical protein
LYPAVFSTSSFGYFEHIWFIKRCNYEIAALLFLLLSDIHPSETPKALSFLPSFTVIPVVHAGMQNNLQTVV